MCIFETETRKMVETENETRKMVETESLADLWIDSQPESEEKQRLLSIIETKVSIEFTLAQLRQET